MHPSRTEPAADTARVVGAIPARYASERLPGKVLRPLAGKPMIEHVYRRAAEAPGLDRVVVLTDDPRVAEAVTAFGGSFEMTPADCASGTDRIAWAARSWSDAAVVNIQGDEPLIEPAAIGRVARHLLDQPGDPVVTLAALADSDRLQDPNLVKVVCDRRGYALYFSRSAVPYPRNPAAAPVLGHLGIYGYQRSALLELAALEPTPLERAESLEQLRALEHGIPIRVLQIAAAWGGVDTMQDFERAEARLRELAQREERETGS